MKLIFDDCDYYRDFEACCDLPEWWDATDEECQRYWMWFKAYDITHREDLHEEELADKGYEFECEVVLADNWLTHIEIAKLLARNKEEAEQLLQLAADALYE